MNTEDLYGLLKQSFQQDARRNVFLLTGPPGIGKTAIPAQAAEATSKACITFALTSCDETDLRGRPMVKQGRTVWASPLPREGQGVLILDEVTSAQPAVQVAAHHIVQAEKGSDTSLGEGWHIVLTANGAADRTFYRTMPAPLRNRLIHISVEQDLTCWAKYAMSKLLQPEIISFLRWRPELLTTKEIPSDGAFPSGRAWFNVGSILNLAVSSSVERELVAGTVGEGAATEFCAHLRMVRELPSIKDIMANQSKAAVPSSPSLLYALATSLAQHARTTSDSAMEFVSRMPAEFALLYIKEVRDYCDIRSDKHVREWISKHKSLFERSL